MGLFDRVERGLEGAVNGVFTRAFKSNVQPLDIATRLEKELETEARVLSRDKKLVPNDFVVSLSKHDYDRLAPYARTLNAEIVPDLREHAAERKFVFNGPIRITYLLDETLTKGRFIVSSEAIATVSETGGASSTTSIRRAPLVLEVNGVRHPLTPPGFTIGRGSEADLRINDPGISRQHARINVSGEDDNLTVSIEDLGSTNGITVNGQRVEETTLSDGSRIEIGSTRMLVHSPVGS